MPARNGSLKERVSSSFKQLSTAANYLNNVSDELGAAISSIECALRELNLGVTVWIKFAQYVDEDNGELTQDEIGYAKANYSWGFYLRRLVKAKGAEDFKVEGPWPFNNASRDFRLQSVSKIPDLLEKLSKEVSAKANDIKPTVDLANEFAEAVKAVTSELEGDPEESFAEEQEEAEEQKETA